MPPGRFPAVEEAIAAGACDDGNEDDLQHGLDHILDGVEVLMRTRGLKGEEKPDGGRG